MQICLRNPVRSSLLIFALLAALALAACGGEDSTSGDTGPDPATVTPGDAPIYFEAVVRPEGEQKDDVLAALSKLLSTDDPAAMIEGSVESSLSEEGFSYSEDVAPWLGQRAAFFLTDATADSGEGALVVATTDTGAASDALEKAISSGGEPVEDETYEGVSYKTDGEASVGIVGDFLVAGTKQGFESAVDASSADSLADNSEAASALDSAPSESLFEAYVDVAAVLDLAVDAGAVTQKDLDAAGDQLDAATEGPVVFSGAATADSMSIEFSGAEGAEGTATEIVSTLPSEAWLAFGIPMVGEAIGAGYENLLQSVQSSLSEIPGADLPGGELPDVNAEIEGSLGLDPSKDLDWIGDVGGFVQGTSVFGLGGGFVIETDDPDAAADAVAKLAKTLGRRSDLTISETQEGFQLQAGPAGAEVAIRDDKVVFAGAGVTVDDVISPPETLADADGFNSASSALGDDLEASLYVDFGAIVALIEGSGQAAGPEFGEIKPVLDALQYLVAGGGTSDGRSVGRLVLGLQEGGGSSGAAAALTP